ncbi:MULTISPECIES: DNA polymerase IV [Sorangium]|uniref:DNA polymerase IV n=1 Tax=Sorangium cellulosum TaxID=56 RepID=A0A4P2QK59_SORCE|nr:MULTISPECIES: DNA polymerase IV [Sorangium]AUX29823.1 DNA polymerase IV [Sorangium cellulosum]WCQ89211.1 DNA polymerase IV [Sorangium sp. Soce836]
MRQILHIDMDAFFASVEQLDDPSLQGRPVLVGGASRRGVVAAASYEARPSGARSAMPMAEAIRRCPQAIVVPPRHARYAEVSAQVFAIFRRFTPLVEGLSLDEAFLDVTASRALFGDGVAIAAQIKRAIQGEIGLTASAGVAPCKFAAKIASDLQKPDGLVVVPDDVAAFLAPLPLERMWGVGPRAAERLRAAGLATIGDLARCPAPRLSELLGPAWGEHVRLLAAGVDERAVVPGRVAESIGAEETVEEDLRGREPIERWLLELSGRVARRLLKAGLSCRAVAVKLKYSDFTLRTRQAKLPEPVADTDSIYACARGLLSRFDLSRPVRLVGVAAGDLTSQTAGPTLSLFPVASERRRRLEGVVAEVAERFGGKGLTRAALLERGPPGQRGAGAGSGRRGGARESGAREKK